jgi:hypothetical protein
VFDINDCDNADEALINFIDIGVRSWGRELLSTKLLEKYLSFHGFESIRNPIEYGEKRFFLSFRKK